MLGPRYTMAREDFEGLIPLRTMRTARGQGRRGKEALGFAISTDLLTIDDTRTRQKVCLTANGLFLAEV
jgi:hypothetical protein